MNLNGKYRPSVLEDVLGQEAVTSVLEKQLAINSLRQCLLFVGPAGTGKTTVARILAKRLDAETFEIDAASHNGVNDVRQIQDEASKKSMTKSAKMFILDEVHAMTTQAWQALLKIIEEPPVNVYFIFCTTECHKIPETIMSRVQRYDFRRISEDGIIANLEYIRANEPCSVPNAVLSFIAERSGGCMRKAVEELEKCISCDIVNLEDAQGLFSSVTVNDIRAFIVAVNKADVNREVLFTIIDKLRANGVNYRHFLNQCLAFELDLCRQYIEAGDKDVEVFLQSINWLIDVRRELYNEDMPYEYLVSRALLGVKGIGT